MQSPSPFGGTKSAEYRRSAELFQKICKEQGAYLAMAFLVDSGYEYKDLKEILALMDKPKIKR